MIGMSPLALCESRQMNGKGGQAIIEIAPKPSLLDFGFEVAIGRGNDAHIDLARPLAPSGRISPSCSTRSSFT